MKIEAQLLLCLIVEFARPQFMSSRRLTKTPCELRGTALVEQFFNVIFAEFQHSPPTCICVQMCPDQPTYCYPNGCFKKAEKKKEIPPVSSIQQDAKTVFLVDNDRDVIDDLLGGNVNLMSPSAVGNPEKTYREPWMSNLMGSTNPSKEILFKYKRLPKLQMKYNLREQIKHTRDKKADVDLSKTRWPTNKQINRQIYQQKTSNYLPAVIAKLNQAESPKYFKRYLTKRENQIGLDISALYLYKDASNFSLGTLIDSLIGRGLEGTNSTLNNSDKSKDGENNDDVQFINSVEDSQNDTKKTAVEITLITNTTEDNDLQYKDSININNSTAAYFEMMTTLSKQIDKQNNLSMKVMSNLMSDTLNSIDELKSTTIANESIKTDLKTSAETTRCTTDTVPTSIQVIPVINNQIKKSKQRVVRKLRNRKLN